MKGYKIFNPDFTCRGFQYKVGETYNLEGDLSICHNGFHFCTKPSDCFNYYDFNSNNKVCEVEALGEIVQGEDDGDTKCATSRILIARELSWHEVLDLVNTGKNNTGLGNTGYRNTGDSNTGYRNTGDRNTGDSNTGDRNTGDSNTGYRNTGDRNTGDSNTGYRNTGDSNTGDSNTGDSNTGDFNICNFSSGVFCTITPKLLIFDTPTDMTLEDWRDSEPAWILRKLNLIEWIYPSDMTDEEKAEHKEHETTGGYLKKNSYNEAWDKLWKSLNDDEKDIIQRIPNFDKDKFEKITGIKLEEI